MFGRKFHGSALVYGLIIMTAVAIVLTSILVFITSQTKYALQIHSREQAFQIAESGIDFYRWYLAHQVEGRTAQQVATFWTSGSPYGVGIPYEMEYTDGGVGIGKYKLTVTPPEDGSTSITVKSEGWTYRHSTDIRTLTVRLRRPSWSENAVLANDNMRFGAGTEVFGKIISNKGIRFDGLAHNVVSSAVATYDDPDHGGGNEFGVHTHVAPVDPLPPATVPARTDVFEAGRSFPVASIDFNGVLGDLSFMKSEAQAGRGTYFDNSGVGRQITLLTDGTFDVCTANTYSAYTGYYDGMHTNAILNYQGIVSGGSAPYNGAACVTIACCTSATCAWVQSNNHNKGKCVSKSNYPIVNNGVIFVEDNVWLSGQINTKRISVVAADLANGPAPSVYIPNSVTYTNYNGDDIIGIIGQKNIEIPRNSSNILRIDGALLAQQGRIGREYYNGIVKSTITIYGAMATNLRYGFAYTNGTGYTTRNLYYDNNLLYHPPPYFPTGTQYQMDLWEEK
ncbi:MAG: hypothetical protein CO143_02075 [Candidatus Moranbacteria bacterium CG_4_9_14_3_um_filter_45_14]|nr:MAG: hypothetical protein CO143_02075 [Candidatus Moranbacteria bacterium CG_4_9_14_3_um_filter_45_14]